MSGWFGSDETRSREETKIGALRIQNSSQGLAIPIVFGKTRITSNLLWYGDFTAIPATSQEAQGGKGGGTTTTTTTTYTYSVGVIFGLMEGPSVQSNFIGQVWSDKDLTDPTALGLSLFDGSYSQAPWTYLTTNHANEALSYRGHAYAATGALDLGTRDGLPNLSFEVIGLVSNTDVNLANVAIEMLTNNKFGAGWPSANLSNLAQFHSYCNAANFVASPAFVAQQPMAVILKDLARLGNSGVVWSDGQLKIIPYADTAVGAFTPDLTVQYALTLDDFLADDGEDPVKVERKRQADSYNVVRVECLSRDNQYNVSLVEAKDQGAIDLYGLRPMEQISAKAICEPAIGRKVAQAILQRELYVRNIYTFRLGWKYARLEPMDIVSLTDANLGLDQQPVRIISIEEDEFGTLELTAEELNIGQSTPGSYGTQTGGNTPAPTNIPPGNAIAPVIFQPPLALSSTRPQIWLGSAGGPYWGGAQIWVSTDDTTFQRVGTLPGPARIGVLTANFPAGSDPDVTNTLSVDLSVSNGVLTSAANEVADSMGTLSYVSGANGEMLSYTVANLTGNYAYDLTTYIQRAQGGSTIEPHLVGDDFMRLDSAIGKFDVPPALFGTTIFIKLLSYNTTGGAVQGLADVTSYPFNVVAQVITNGVGYPYRADLTSTANSAPGAGLLRFNNASQANATQLYIDNLTSQGANMSALFADVGSTGLIDLRDATDTSKWATYSITGADTPSGYHVFNVSYLTGGLSFANGAAIDLSFNPVTPVGISSVGLNMPAVLFNTTNTPLTAPGGTIEVALATQNANLVFAGPASGNAAQPTWRTLVPADIPGGNGPGGVGSVGLNMPATVFNVTNTPLTANGTLEVAFLAQNAALVLAGPTSGNATAPVFRALEQGDLPAQPFDVFTFYPGVPAANTIIYRGKVARPIAAAANFAGSQFTATANAAANAVFDVQKNGASIGNLTVLANSTTGVFLTANGAAQSLTTGDILGVVSPGPADANLANPAITFVFTR